MDLPADRRVNPKQPEAGAADPSVVNGPLAAESPASIPADTAADSADVIMGDVNV
jgi:hypothetical protein